MRTILLFYHFLPTLAVTQWDKADFSHIHTKGVVIFRLFAPILVFLSRHNISGFWVLVLFLCVILYINIRRWYLELQSQKRRKKKKKKTKKVTLDIYRPGVLVNIYAFYAIMNIFALIMAVMASISDQFDRW